ncbi:hypothetical protein SUGI_0222330 [Cryptomeria japonica]|nr:hypothetical protein SUGI_0222330 [Cryptomeria japonica]
MASYRSGLLCAIMFLAIHGGWAQTSDTISNACSNALYTHFCVSSLSKASGALEADLTQLSVIAVRLSSEVAKPVSRFIEKLKKRNPNVSALEDCSDLLKDTREQLHDSQSELKQLSNVNFMEYVEDVLTRLSGVETNQDTCLSGLKESNVPATLVSSVKDNTDNLTMWISDALAVVSTLRQQGHI